MIGSTTTSPGGVGARISDRLARSIGPQKFALWFDRSARLDYDDAGRTLRVAVPSAFAAQAIRSRFEQQLRAAAEEEIGQTIELDVAVEPASFADAPAPDDAKTVATRSQPRNAEREVKPMRMLRHRLEDFVVGPSNELAFAAAARVAEEDGDTPAHPLFIHGACGVGKTHLLQGVCRRRLGHDPGARVRYTTGEQFTNEYIAALHSRKIEAFRNAVRRLDLLAVDDIHFLATREKTQEEFLHCFDRIDLSGARIVLASDSHPKLIAKFSAALVSRCVRGMVVQVHPPDADTRAKLLRVLAERRGMVLQVSAIDALVRYTDGSVRDIEGVLNRLHALASLIDGNGNGRGKLSEPIGHALVDRLLEADRQPIRCKPVRFDTVMGVVTQQLGVNARQVVGPSRHRHVVLARSLVVYLTRQTTAMSFPEIARAMDRRNHSTIVTAAQRMQKQIERNEPVLIPGEIAQTTPRELVDRLRRAIEKV